VDTDLFRPERATRAMRERLTAGHPDDPLIVCVSRLSFEKRIDWLYAPVTQIPGVRLALIGSGPAEADLKARFAGTNTVFTGYMEGAELAAAYASADVFAFPSDTETLGFVAMEAMASGVPAVGARAGGIPDVIEHEVNGLLFTPLDLGDLTRQVRRLIADPALRERLGRRARLDMEKVSWRAATEALVKHYETAIRGHRRFDPPSRFCTGPARSRARRPGRARPRAARAGRRPWPPGSGRGARPGPRRRRQPGPWRRRAARPGSAGRGGSSARRAAGRRAPAPGHARTPRAAARRPRGSPPA